MTTTDGNDPIVEEVRDLLLQRSQRGMVKYGTILCDWETVTPDQVLAERGHAPQVES